MIFSNNKIIAVDFIRRYAESTKRGMGYKRVYMNIAKKLALFSEAISKKIKSDMFDYSTAEQYVNFLISKGLKHNTIKHIYDKTKFMFRLMRKRGYKVNMTFEDLSISEEATTAIYLTDSEIKKIYSLKGLSEDNRLVADLFVIGCCTGFRYSDYAKLTNENIKENSIIRKTVKTGEIVHIPIHYLVSEIIGRYNGLPIYKKSQQNFNIQIKKIAKKAEISTKVLIEYTKGGKIERTLKSKWELIGTHTARRSFATNAYLAGIPTFRIMLMTGHKSETAFFKYIRIQKEENADVLSNHKFFKRITTS